MTRVLIPVSLYFGPHGANFAVPGMRAWMENATTLRGLVEFALAYV